MPKTSRLDAPVHPLQQPLKDLERACHAVSRAAGHLICIYLLCFVLPFGKSKGPHCLTAMAQAPMWHGLREAIPTRSRRAHGMHGAYLTP